jgi:hypothetical protein
MEGLLGHRPEGAQQCAHLTAGHSAPGNPVAITRIATVASNGGRGDKYPGTRKRARYIA